jgi:hypothetical protein
VIRWSNGDLLPARWFEETLEPFGPQAKAVAHFGDGRVAAVESAFGLGKTLTIGSFVSAAYTTTPDAAVERFYRGLLKWAGVREPVQSSDSDIEVRWTESGGDAIVFVFNHGKTAAAPAAKLSGYADKATDLSSGRELTLSGLRLEPGHVAVVRVARSSR